jgi:hypothetical protein
MDNVSEGLLSMTMSEALHRSREKAALGQMHQQTQSLCHVKQYTESITLVRSSMFTSKSTARRHAVLGTIICLAYFDVSVMCCRERVVADRSLDAAAQEGRVDDTHARTAKSD